MMAWIYTWQLFLYSVIIGFISLFNLNLSNKLNWLSNLGGCVGISRVWRTRFCCHANISTSVGSGDWKREPGHIFHRPWRNEEHRVFELGNWQREGVKRKNWNWGITAFIDIHWKTCIGSSYSYQWPFFLILGLLWFNEKLPDRVWWFI